MATQGEIRLHQPATGEIMPALDAGTLLAAAGIQVIGDAETVQLAQFDANARELEEIAREARGLVSDEIVRRLDRDGKWTLREGGYEIKAASPEAGTVAYDTDLREALADLVASDIISAQGANAALECVQPTAPVPYGLLRAIARALDGRDSQGDEWVTAQEVERLLADEPEPTYVQRAGGIKALLKVPGARKAIEACQIAVQPPRRVARVKSVEARRAAA